MPLNILLFGAPGCGKGSASVCLVKDFGFLHISAGELLRYEVERKTPLGMQVEGLMTEGSLIPDTMIVKIIVNRVLQPDARDRGVLLDGYPRTLTQAKALAASGFKIDAVIFINVDPKSLEERCLERRLDPVTGRVYNLKSDPPPKEIMERLLVRSDDTREKHRRRMQIYREQKASLMKYYQGKIIEVDGNPPFPVVYAVLRSKIVALREESCKRSKL